MGKWVFSTAFFTFLLLVIVTEARAVDYELPDTDGQMQSLDQYKGKWVIVNYWATWCAPCIKELPYFEKINQEGLILLTITFPVRVS